MGCLYRRSHQRERGMTPERAAEIAENAAKYTCGSSVDADVIAGAIIKACAEQRQEYADLMDEAAEDVAEWGSYADEYVQNKWNLEGTIQSWQDRAAAIRGQT